MVMGLWLFHCFDSFAPSFFSLFKFFFQCAVLGTQCRVGGSLRSGKLGLDVCNGLLKVFDAFLRILYSLFQFAALACQFLLLGIGESSLRGCRFVCCRAVTVCMA